MSVTVEEIKNICFLNLSLEEKIQITNLELGLVC